MDKGKRYYQEYKNMIVDLYKSGMSLAELNSEYGISKSRIKEENEILEKLWLYFQKEIR